MRFQFNCGTRRFIYHLFLSSCILPAAAVMGAVNAPGKKGEGNPWKHGIFGENAATCTACRVGGKPTATA